LAAVLSGGDADFRALFGRVTDPLPIAVVMAVLVLASVEYTMTTLVMGREPLWWAYNAVRLGVFYLTLATLTWAYFAGLWALNEVGSHPLGLLPLEEDALMGLRPAGSLALALAIHYFGLLGLVAMAVLLGKPSLPYTLNIVVFAVVGLYLFFAPLYRIHDQMDQAKKARQRVLRRRILEAAERPPIPARPAAAADAVLPPSGDPSLAELRDATAHLAETRSLDAAWQRVEAAPDWPFDPDTLRILAAVALPVLLAIATDIARRVMGF
jgi:hypothetical protein